MKKKGKRKEKAYYKIKIQWYNIKSGIRSETSKLKLKVRDNQNDTSKSLVRIRNISHKIYIKQLFFLENFKISHIKARMREL